jgi:hypothetical protein
MITSGTIVEQALNNTILGVRNRILLQNNE